MKRRLWIAVGVVVLGCGAVWAVVAVKSALLATKPALAAMLPEGALLSIEARDFGSLLKDWDGSKEKRTWLTSDNYSDFSNSRLFSRLSQAQDEFSAAADLATDESLLKTVAGKESCLGLYDIGNLEFVYVTKMGSQAIESTPLWQTRAKFEQRTEAGTPFYVRKDEQSSRTAAFASRDGWLILGTREDLVAGVLDRMAGIASHNLATEGWYAETVKQAAGEPGDLRMVLNLDKIVPSPYFRTYWVQQNITEMKQYTAAISDLYRTAQAYREERVLVRRAGIAAGSQGDVRALAALAPEDAAFYAAQASPSPEALVNALRENLLEVKAQPSRTWANSAPEAPAAENAGSAADLDVSIDHAPAVVAETDVYAPLRALLQAQQPDASLEVFTTRAPDRQVFVSVQAAMVISASRDWNEGSVREALSAALAEDLTAGKIGINWAKRSGAAGNYLALDGGLSLFVAVKGKQLLVANDSELLEKLLAAHAGSVSTDTKDGVTYAAVFRSAQERENFRLLSKQLDLAGQHAVADQQPQPAGDKGPAFFSGDIASLWQVFSGVESAEIQERDQGARVTQTVVYTWAR